jgi:hypothetical protein
MVGSVVVDACPRSLLLAFGPWFFTSSAVAAGPSTHLIPFGYWLYSSPWFTFSPSLLVRALFCSPSAPGSAHRHGCSSPSLLVRALFCSPSAPGSAHRHGWFCRRRCWFELSSARLRLLALLITMVGYVAVAVGSSSLLLAFGSWFCSSPWLVLSPSLLVRALFCSPSAR